MLIYKNLSANQETDITEKEVWTIGNTDNKFLFRRFVNGVLNESYATVNQDIAAIYSVSIILGFQPPRNLSRQDKPVG